MLCCLDTFFHIFIYYVETPNATLETSTDPNEYVIPEEGDDPPPKIPYPERSTVPVSEFNTPFLATMAFPSLFPFGNGDPFGNYINANKKTVIEKIRHLIFFTEKEVVFGKTRLVSRFARHPRFILWACNIFFRHRTLAQGDIYLKQYPGDANKTVAEIQEMLEEKQATYMINNIRRYMANIPGTPSYWFNAAAELDAIIDSRGPPTLFFTYTYADR